MRIASRHMPKYRSGKSGRMLWVLLAVPVAGFLCCVFSATLATAVVVLLIFAGILVAHKEARRDEEHLRCLVLEREGESICEFARDFDTRQVDTWIVRAVYEQLQCHLKHVHPAFPVRAADRLKADLHFDDEDLDIDIAEEIEQRTGRSCEGSEENPYFGKVKTARDLVMFFQAQPKGKSVHAAGSAEWADRGT